MINIENLSQITRFDSDDKPHIIYKKKRFAGPVTATICVQACPAKCYTYTEETGRLDVVYENCLECGTCLVICEKKAVEWKYPRGGYGVHYRMT